MTCNHDLAERETACADGMCPLCLAKRVETLQADCAKLTLEVSRLEAERDNWSARAGCGG